MTETKSKVSSISSKLSSKWLVTLGVAVFATFLFYLNTLYAYYPGDDLIFSLKIPEKGIIGSEPINSISDLLESQYNFYNNYHYRVLNHTLLQILLALPPIIFDITNVLIFLWLPWPILRILKGEALGDFWLKYFVILLLIWIFHIDLGWSYFLATGSLNYTWMLIPQLWYLGSLILYLEGEDVSKGGMIFLAITNALANENACVMLLTSTLLVMLLSRGRDCRFLWWILFIMIVGGVFMLVSPSMAKRLATQGHMDGGLLAHTKEFAIRTVYYCIRYMPLFSILLFTNAKVVVKQPRHFVLVVAFLSATFSMILAPLFEPRSAVLGFFILIMLFVSVAKGVWRRWPIFFIIALTFLTCIMRLPRFIEQADRYEVNQDILKKNRGSKSVVYLKPYCDNSRLDYLLCFENSADTSGFYNRSAAAYYDIEGIALADEFVSRKRRASFFKRLQSDKLSLQKFDRKHFPDGTALFYERLETGMEMIIETIDDEAPFFIVRGAASYSLKHKLSSLLPQNIQTSFLDFLEESGVRQQEVLRYQNKTYNYFFVPNYNRYDFLMISEYDFGQHAPVGIMYRIDLK